MSGKLILTHGLMGSGKSTWARKEFENNPNNVVVVERDNIREQLFGKSYHSKTPDKKSENQVNICQEKLISDGLRSGKTVIVADTNLNTRTIGRMVNFAKKYGSNVEQKYFDVSLEECLRRNAARGLKGDRMVPEHIIRAAAERSYGEDGHLKNFMIASNGTVSAVPQTTEGSKLIDSYNEEMAIKNPLKGKAVVLLDVDGTLVNNHFDSVKYLNNKDNKKKDFDGFYKGITDAPFNQSVLDLVKKMHDNDDLNIVVSTGRDDKYAKELINKLKESNLPINMLLMKKLGDFSPSSDQKLRNIHLLRDKGLVVVHAIDDRQKDLEMFNREGILTSSVDVPVLNDSMLSNDDVPFPKVNTIYGSGFCIRCGSPLKSGENIGPVCRLK